MNEIEKQIEEMAREIAKRDCPLFENCPKELKYNCLSQEPAIMLESSKNYIAIATWLINAGYRNVKDKVVLSKEEWANLQGKAWANFFKEAEILQLKEEYEMILETQKHLEKEYSDMRDKINLYKSENEIIKQNYIQLKQDNEQARKEMAREIFAKLQGYYHQPSDTIILDVDDFYKLAKQYGVEVEE